MNISQLKKHIHQKERQIETKKALIHQEYQQLKTTITSPAALFTAFLTGFIVTYCYRDKNSNLSDLIGHFLTAKNLFSLLI